MQTINKGRLTAFGALALLLAAQAGANGFYADAPDSDIKMCVSAIGEEADYRDAGRVRHDVVTAKRRTVGYLLEIETRVYDAGSGAVIREYQSECTATGGQAPSRLRVVAQDH